MNHIHTRRRPWGGVRATALALLAATAWPLTGDAQTPSAAARAVGDTLSLRLREAQRLVLRQGPEFLATQQERAIARGELRQARLPVFNPEFGVIVPSGRGSTAIPGELALSQGIEIGGQRGLRATAARLGVTRADAIVGDAARTTLADVSRAFLAAVAADRRREIAEATLALNQRLVEAVRIQAREGEVSALEANLAEIELGRARARSSQAQRELTTAQLELKRLLGLMPDAAVQPVVDSSFMTVGSSLDANATAQDSLIAVALRQRPDVAASAATIRELETLTSLARRGNVPNLRAGVVTERDRKAGIGLGVSVGLSLPLLNRNQGLVDRRRAELAQATLQARATELRVRVEVAAAWRTLRAAEQELAAYTESVLEPARYNSTLLETAYRAGKITLPTLLLLRSQLFEAELGYWDAWVTRNDARVRLDEATGALLNDTTLYSMGADARAGTP